MAPFAFAFMLLSLLCQVDAAAEVAKSLKGSPVLPSNPILANGSCPMVLRGDNFYQCYDRGVCDPVTFECQCELPYGGPSCGYKLKSRKLTFVLSFLFGSWGASRLYLNFVGMGLLGLGATFVLMFVPCIPLWCMCLTHESAELKKYHRMVVRLCIAALLVLTVFWMLDFIWTLYLTTDGQGYKILNDL